MTEPLRLAEGKWIRFPRYELRGGCIAPVRGSEIEVYDPWTLPEHPYKSLSELVKSTDVLTMPGQRPEIVAAAIEWCNRYGLLGTLLHRVVAVTYPARWKRLEFQDKIPRDEFWPEQTTRVSVMGAWRGKTRTFSYLRSQDPAVLGQVVPAEDLAEQIPQPGATLIDLPGVGSLDGVIQQEALDQTWGRHFPDVPEFERATFDYPAPTSLEFWSLYGEPVNQFIVAAYVLCYALKALLEPRNPEAPRIALSRLSQLAHTASPGLEQQPDGSFRPRWVATSLLSTLALMAMDDLAKGQLHRCATCGALFLSGAHQVEYCTDRCRRTMQKRRFRERNPDYERQARHARNKQKES